MNVEQMLTELNAADDFLRHPQWTEGYLANCLVFLENALRLIDKASE